MEFKKNVGYSSQASSFTSKNGKMGTQTRWRVRCDDTPGVGDYDLTKFKRLDKASETQFYHTQLTAQSPTRKLGGPAQAVTNSLN